MRRTKTLKILFAVVAMTFAWSSVSPNAYAATGLVYISPSSASVANQANATFAINIDPGTDINSVTFVLNWDASQFKYVGFDASGSAFGVKATEAATTNSLTIGRGSFDYLNTTSLIGRVTLQALAGSGSASLTLTNVRSYDRNYSGGETYLSPAVSNATVTLTTPGGTPPATGGTGSGTGTGTTTSPGGSTKPSGGTTTGSTTTGTTTTPTTSAGADTTPPKVVNVDTGGKNVQFSTANISLSTDEPTQVYIKYGTGDQLNLQTSLSELAKTHSISLGSIGLIPGTEYSYQVIVKDAQGNIAESPVKTFKTKGYTLHVTVLDKNNNPLKNSRVTLHSSPMTAKTDSHGVVEFSDVAPGAHHVTYSDGGKDYSQAVAVDDAVVTNKASGTQSAATQNVAVQFAVVAKSGFPVYVPLIILLGLAGAAVFVYMTKMRTVRQPISPALAAVTYPTTTLAVPVPAPTQAPDTYTSPSTTTTTASVPAAQTPATIETAHGVATPNPGSVVAPKDPNGPEQ